MSRPSLKNLSAEISKKLGFRLERTVIADKPKIDVFELALHDWQPGHDPTARHKIWIICEDWLIRTMLPCSPIASGCRTIGERDASFSPRRAGRPNLAIACFACRVQIKRERSWVGVL